MISYRKELPISAEVDVVVAGAGSAGIAAAVAAARMGMKTLVIEQHGSVGGMATNGLVGPFMTSFNIPGDKQIIVGMFEEMVQRMMEIGGAIHPKDIGPRTSYSGYYFMGHNHVGPFDHEAYKLVGTRMLLEAGVEIMLHTVFTDVIMDGERIDGIVINNKAGLSVIKAKQFIDCTGDADVAAYAGAPCWMGNGEGDIQPATLFFRVCNVDTEKLDAYMAENAKEHPIMPFYGPFSWLIKEHQDEWDVPRCEVCLFESPVKGEFRLNVTRILNIDGTKPEDLTKAELVGLEQVHKVLAFLKKYAPGFENCIFMGTANTIGLRETRHIDGMKVLRKENVLACEVPDDTIAVFATSMDTHHKGDNGGDYFVLENGPFYGVPYGIMVPKKVENLLVAGRSVSADEVGSSTVRMIPCCIAFGQAAGIAAAQAIQSGKTPATIDVQALRDELRRQGGYLGE